MVDTEQRSPTLVTIQQAPPIEGRDALVAEIDRLNSLLAAEEARIKEEEVALAPPPPWEEILLALLQAIIAYLGNPTSAEHNLKQLRRALGK